MPRYKPSPAGLARDVRELSHVLALALSRMDRGTTTPPPGESVGGGVAESHVGGRPTE